MRDVRGSHDTEKSGSFFPGPCFRRASRCFSLFVVDTKTEGFKKGKKLKKMGMKAQDTAELFFEDMRVPASAMLGEEGKGFMYLMEELPQER